MSENYQKTPENLLDGLLQILIQSLPSNVFENMKAEIISEYKRNIAAKRAERVSEFKKLRSELWIKTGQTYRKRRENLRINISEVSRAVGVSWGVIKRFESGEPVTKAEIIPKSYGMYLKMEEFKCQLQKLC